MRKVLHAVRFIVFFIVFGMIFYFVQYMLTSDGQSQTRVMIHEMYTSEENIDTLFLGSSHTYRQYIPSIIDDCLGVHSYNAGSSAQHLDGSYALLVEAGKNNDLDTVFVELCPAYKGKTFSERTSLVETYIIGDYLDWGLNKIQFLLNASSEKYYVNSFFPLLRNKEKYYEIDYVVDAIKLKFNEDYLNFKHPGDPETEEEWYEDRGYVANNEIVYNENWTAKELYEPIEDKMFSEDELKTLNKIVHYCKKNDIRLIFISTALTDFDLALYGNYDNGREQIASFAEENGVEYYDFNLCKPDYFTYESTKFKDITHMNCYGAEEYSKLVGRFFDGQIKKEDLFYNSFDDKISEMGKKVLGIVYNVETTQTEKIIHMTPILTNDFTPYASISKAIIGDRVIEPITVGQPIEDLHFSTDEMGTITIEVTGDSPKGDVTNIITIGY